MNMNRRWGSQQRCRKRKTI